MRGFISPPSSAEWPFAFGRSGFRERLSTWTPRKVTINPASNVTVLVPPVVLNPWNKMRDATMVAVENPT